MSLSDRISIDLRTVDLQLAVFRSSVAMALAARKRTEQQYNQAENEVNKWQRRAKLAWQKGDESLARLALEQKKIAAATANALKTQLDEQTVHVDSLKCRLSAWESKISEAKTQSRVGRLSTSSAMAALERMEEKISTQGARAKAAEELVGGDLESQFAALEASSDFDDELAALTAQILGAATPQNQLSLPQASEQSAKFKYQVVDAELEDLKRQLERL
ncbi:MAG: PspA/IM30 family protein [Chroococcidiopsis sp.]